jgi:hypothetical protein
MKLPPASTTAWILDRKLAAGPRHGVTVMAAHHLIDFLNPGVRSVVEVLLYATQ